MHLSLNTILSTTSSDRSAIQYFEIRNSDPLKKIHTWYDFVTFHILYLQSISLYSWSTIILRRFFPSKPHRKTPWSHVGGFRLVNFTLSFMSVSTSINESWIDIPFKWSQPSGLKNINSRKIKGKNTDAFWELLEMKTTLAIIASTSLGFSSC